MISPILDKAIFILLGLILTYLFKSIRPWIKTRKEMAQEKEKEKEKAETKRQSARYFSGLIFICGVALALGVSLAVTVSQTSPGSPIVLLLAGGAAALSIMGVLLLVVGLPAYNYVLDLEQKLEDQYRRMNRQYEFLEYQYRSLEDRYEKL